MSTGQRETLGKSISLTKIYLKSVFECKISPHYGTVSILSYTNPLKGVNQNQKVSFRFDSRFRNEIGRCFISKIYVYVPKFAVVVA